MFSMVGKAVREWLQRNWFCVWGRHGEGNTFVRYGRGMIRDYAVYKCQHCNQEYKIKGDWPRMWGG